MTKIASLISPQKKGSFTEILECVFQILAIFSPRRKLQLITIIILQMISGISEILSLGALIPFIAALSAPEKLYNRPEIQTIIEFFHISSPQDLIYWTSALFIAAFSCATCFRVFIFWAQSKFNIAIGVDLNSAFFKSIIFQNYEYFLNTNSGILISRLINDINSTLRFISSAMMLLAQIFTIFSIALAIIFINPIIALVIFTAVSVFYISVTLINKKALNRNGIALSESFTSLMSNLQTSIYGIRNIILDDGQHEALKQYTGSYNTFRKKTAQNQFLIFLPRNIIEIITLTILVIVAAYISIEKGNLLEALPVLTALALATIRVLPAAQTLYGSYASMQSTQPSVIRVLDILYLTHNNSHSHAEPITAPKSSIKLSDLWFKFTKEDGTSSEWILKGIHANLPANKVIAFVGKTGSGKTTLSDIILGLLQAHKGDILIDDQPLTEKTIISWRRHIASVPQFIYLADKSVKENIAYGVPLESIDLERVKHVCELSQIKDLIEGRPNTYDELIGENGLKLSGGQRQRIGIARALYKNGSVLVLDEATSALDNKTERSVMDMIDTLKGKQTIIIIAHRLDTIKNADVIYVIDDGQIESHGTYNELLKTSQCFQDIVYANKNKVE